MRYAVLRHTGGEGGDHFDLLVEQEPGRGDLLTWRLPAWPVVEGTEAIRLRDHRRIYLTYEGEVAGGRGVVMRVGDGDAALEIVFGDIKLTFPDGSGILLSQLQEERWWVKPA